MTKPEELVKLKAQIADERFLSKAPAAAIQKVRDRIVKLQREVVFVEDWECENGHKWWKIFIDGEEHLTRAKKFDEGEWGYVWHFLGGERNELCAILPNQDTGQPGMVSISLYFASREALLRVWIELNTYWVSPYHWSPREKQPEPVLVPCETIADHPSDPQPTGTASCKSKLSGARHYFLLSN